MKTYVKPEISVENLFSATTVAADPFDLNVTGGANKEVDFSATPWWDILG